MNWKHLLWIVPFVLMAGFLAGTQVCNTAYNHCVDGLIESTILLDSIETANYKCLNGSYEGMACTFNERIRRQIELTEAWDNITREVYG